MSERWEAIGEAVDALLYAIGLVTGIFVGVAFVLAGMDLVAGRHASVSADRALCESRGGVWLTAPVEPGCYRVERMSDGE